MDREHSTEGQVKAGDDVCTGRVGVGERAVPVDAEHRVGVLVGELHDGPLGRDVHAVQVGEVEVADRHRPHGVGPVLPHVLHEPVRRRDRIEARDDLGGQSVTDCHPECPTHGCAGRIGVDEVPIGVVAHDRIGVVVRESVDGSHLLARQPGGALMGGVGGR